MLVVTSTACSQELLQTSAIVGWLSDKEESSQLLLQLKDNMEIFLEVLEAQHQPLKASLSEGGGARGEAAPALSLSLAEVAVHLAVFPRPFTAEEAHSVLGLEDLNVTRDQLRVRS